MGYSRNLLWLVFWFIPFFLFSGCGDLEPEMQDTRSVVLKMNFNQRSSSRSSQISQAEISSQKTHLILALPAWEYLSSNYKYSKPKLISQELMNPLNNKVSMEIPLNTQIKIFAFLFREEYNVPQLFSGLREVGYYGESQPFSIGRNTNNLRLNITLQSTSTFTGQTDNTAPIIEQVTAIASPTSDSTPNYIFASTKAGTITYGGSCSSGITSAVSGNNNITFNALINGTYSDCTIKVTDSEGNVSNILTIPPFTVIFAVTIVLYETTTPTRSGNNIVYSQNNSASYSDSDLQADGARIGYRMEVTFNGTDYYAETIFDTWDGITLSNLLFPTVSNANVIQRTVTNMSVVSNYPTVTNTSSTSGRLEIWPYNYSKAANSGIGGNSSIYDFDDTHTGDSSYGSMQVHNLSAAQTVMAWNDHSASQPDIGLGNNPATGNNTHPDWTFSGGRSLGKSNWKFQVLFRR